MGSGRTKKHGIMEPFVDAFEIAKKFRVASRRFYGSPASGSSKRFEKDTKEVIEYVFDKTKNNFR